MDQNHKAKCKLKAARSARADQIRRAIYSFKFNLICHGKMQRPKFSCGEASNSLTHYIDIALLSSCIPWPD